jgi:hypothetical protein
MAPVSDESRRHYTVPLPPGRSGCCSASRCAGTVGHRLYASACERKPATIRPEQQAADQVEERRLAGTVGACDA